MLRLVQFIREHKNWRELLTAPPYCLKITEDEDYILFKYNQISSDFNEKICREARGIILQKGTWRVVRFTFEKFFNLKEPQAAQIDWWNCSASEKIDGSIVSLWYDWTNEKWRVSTNGSLDAYQSELPNPIYHKTFGELFEDTATQCGLDYSLLNPEYCYTFELVSLENKVVISYPEPALYLLSVRDMETLEEKNSYFDIGKGILHPKEYNLNSEEEYRQLIEDMPEGHEGIVVRDGNGNRVKIKTPLYFQLHRQANNGKVSLEHIIDLIRENDTDEFLAYFPEMKSIFEDVRGRLERCNAKIVEVQAYADYWKENIGSKFSKEIARKNYASCNNHELKALYFKAYDGNLREWVDKLTTKQFIKTFNPIWRDLV